MYCMKKFLIIAAVGIMMGGFGCGADDLNQTAHKAVLDSRAHISGTLPAGWVGTPLNTLYKLAKSPSGLGYVAGGMTTGYGPRDEKGGVQVLVQVIAIPKAFLPVFEKSKYPASAARLFEAGPYIIYLAKPTKADVGIDEFVKSLEFRP